MSEHIKETLREMGITVESIFIPFSNSRNKDEKYKSLNWKVTLKINGKGVLTTDYSAGIAHCPSYNKNAPSGFSRSQSVFQRLVTDAECEIGKPVKKLSWSGTCLHDSKYIEPDAVDVLFSLCMDSDVLNYTGLEDWADCMGYDKDSRKAESIWRDCLTIALSLRAALGESGLSKLQTIFEDY